MKKQVNMRLQDIHIDLIDELVSVYGEYGLKFSKADIVQMALASLVGKEAILQKEIAEKIQLRGNLDLRKLGINRIDFDLKIFNIEED